MATVPGQCMQLLFCIVSRIWHNLAVCMSLLPAPSLTRGNLSFCSQFDHRCYAGVGWWGREGCYALFLVRSTFLKTYSYQCNRRAAVRANGKKTHGTPKVQDRDSRICECFTHHKMQFKNQNPQKNRHRSTRQSLVKSLEGLARQHSSKRLFSLQRVKEPPLHVAIQKSKFLGRTDKGQLCKDG